MIRPCKSSGIEESISNFSAEILPHHLFWEHLVDCILFLSDGLVGDSYRKHLFHTTSGKHNNLLNVTEYISSPNKVVTNLLHSYYTGYGLGSLYKIIEYM